MNKQLRRTRRWIVFGRAIARWRGARMHYAKLHHYERLLHEAERNEDEPAYRIAREEQSVYQRAINPYIEIELNT